jgi:hypothetical protein
MSGDRLKKQNDIKQMFNNLPGIKKYSSGCRVFGDLRLNIPTSGDSKNAMIIRSFSLTDVINNRTHFKVTRI